MYRIAPHSLPLSLSLSSIGYVSCVWVCLFSPILTFANASFFHYLPMPFRASLAIVSVFHFPLFIYSLCVCLVCGLDFFFLSLIVSIHIRVMSFHFVLLHTSLFYTFDILFLFFVGWLGLVLELWFLPLAFGWFETLLTSKTCFTTWTMDSCVCVRLCPSVRLSVCFFPNAIATFPSIWWIIYDFLKKVPSFCVIRLRTIGSFC